MQYRALINELINLLEDNKLFQIFLKKIFQIEFFNLATLIDPTGTLIRKISDSLRTLLHDCVSMVQYEQKFRDIMKINVTQSHDVILNSVDIHVELDTIRSLRCFVQECVFECAQNALTLVQLRVDELKLLDRAREFTTKEESVILLFVYQGEFELIRKESPNTSVCKLVQPHQLGSCVLKLHKSGGYRITSNEQDDMKHWIQVGVLNQVSHAVIEIL